MKIVTLDTLKKFKEKIKSYICDSLPVGSIVDYSGTEVPEGWERVTDERIYISSPILTYQAKVKFFTLPYSSGIHSYIITGVVSFIDTVLYSNVMLLVTQTGTNVSINRLVGSSANSYSNEGVDLYAINYEADSPLRLYGVCYVLR